MIAIFFCGNKNAKVVMNNIRFINFNIEAINNVNGS